MREGPIIGGKLSKRSLFGVYNDKRIKKYCSRTRTILDCAVESLKLNLAKVFRRINI